eukprot:TRINITY_DN50220_c0_g1_i1.p1 TRINITY_DN50220_c0_g1~~TRINITY_DN50220_c0_g1_i1.p1  ORF type:complete len:479 (-),score=122.16 TRINITY_DN50220_c0_g1_i1:286-1722(-)
MLRVPKTDKEVEDGSGGRGMGGCETEDAPVAYGVASMQGWRLRMEDAHLALPDFDRARRLSLFGVFDGHGGAAVAKIVAARLPGVLRKQAAFKAGRYEQALKRTFTLLDEYLDSTVGRKEVIKLTATNLPSEVEGENSEEEDDVMDLLTGGEEDEEGEEEEVDLDEDEEGPATLGGLLGSGANDDQVDSYTMWVCGEGPDCMGTTAVVALIRFDDDGAEVFVANAGDSRCVMGRGETAVALSEDHKPILKNELARIKKAGGFVTEAQMGGRVDGNLSLSRALGDFAFKKNKKLKPNEQRIVCEPEVHRRRLEDSDKLLVLGCDGIWEKASSQDVVTFLQTKLRSSPEEKNGTNRRTASPRQPVPLSAACASFLDHNLAVTPAASLGLGCDNMTLLAVRLKLQVTKGPNGSTAPEDLPGRRSGLAAPVRRSVRKAAPVTLGRRRNGKPLVPALRKREILISWQRKRRRQRTCLVKAKST